MWTIEHPVYEYKVVQSETLFTMAAHSDFVVPPKSDASLLSDLGGDGWDLVAVMNYNNAVGRKPQRIFYLQRTIKAGFANCQEKAP